MKKTVWILATAALLLAAPSCGKKKAPAAEPEAAMEENTLDEEPQKDDSEESVPEKVETSGVFDLYTNYGNIRIRLYKDTPYHYDNFTKLVREGFYDGVLFHRIIKDFMIQTGDPFTKDTALVARYGQGGPGYTLPAEFRPEHTHKKGAVAAARLGDMANPKKESSGSQFYIVLNEEHCRHLDGEYTVFGETIDGMDVVEKIGSLPTDAYDRPLGMPRIVMIKPVRHFVDPETEAQEESSAKEQEEAPKKVRERTPAQNDAAIHERPPRRTRIN